MDPNTTNNGGFDQGMPKNAFPQTADSGGADTRSSLAMPQGSQIMQNQLPSQSPLVPSTFAAADEPQNTISDAQTSKNIHVDDIRTTDIDTPPESANIEVEWVSKVEKVVSSTTNDPYAKSHQLSMLKNEYAKKMFGNTLGQEGQK